MLDQVVWWLFGPHVVYCGGTPGPCKCMSGCVDFDGIMALLIAINVVVIFGAWVAYKAGWIKDETS